MAVVRTCPACGRNSGPKHARCMYCGGELPAAAEAASEAPPASPAEGLDPAALALLAQLEQRATPPKPKKKSLFARLRGKEKPAKHAATPPRPPKAQAPVVSPRPPKPPTAPDPLAALAASAPPPATTYAEALTRGGGPFGNRDTAARVVLMPDPSYRPKMQWLKHRLATTLGVDLYTAVQALTRDVPRTLAAFETEAEADEAVAHLREAELQVGVLRRARIAAWPGPQEVTSFTGLDADSVTFGAPGGAELTVPRDRLRLAILGRIEADPNERRPGGGLGRSGGPYTAVDLLVDGLDGPLRVRSDSFDFRTMGDDAGISAFVNLRRLVTELGPGGRPVPLDQRFKRVPHFAALARAADGMEPPLFLRRELEFAEYGLVLALAS